MGTVLSAVNLEQNLDVKDPKMVQHCIYSDDLATDAVDTQEDVHNFVENICGITIETVKHVEDMLELDEKVSLTYLLYEDASEALHEIILLIGDNKRQPVLQWASHKDSMAEVDWKKYLVEALSIIQDYRILHILGFEKQKIIDTYLPTNKFTSYYVDLSRKGLFCIFDNLTSKQANEFLFIVEKEFTSQKKCFRKYNKCFIEMYFLHFEVESFISKYDLANLIKLFKQMNLLNVCDSLRVINTAAIKKNEWKQKYLQLQTQTNQHDETKVNKEPRSSISLFADNAASMPSVSGLSETVTGVRLGWKKSNRYHINESKPGLCLIINEELFYEDQDRRFKDLVAKDLESRYGTHFDRDRLKDTFKKIGFRDQDIINKDNLDHEVLLSKIKEIANTVRDHSSLFVCILSHGEEGVVYGSNSCKIPINKIQSIMSTTNTKYLANKPKVLILQCCQGKTCQKMNKQEESEDSDLEFDGPGMTKSVPTGADMLTFFATIPGYSAFRHKKQGSWFIQTFCDMIVNRYASDHLEEICTATISELTAKRWHKNGEERCMLPQKTSTLTKNFYLFPSDK